MKKPRTKKRSGSPKVERLGGENSMSAGPLLPRIQFLLCAGSECLAGGSADLREALEKEIKKQNLEDEATVVMTGCNGFCAAGPTVSVQPDGIFYTKVKPEHAPRIVEEHVLKGSPVEDLLFKEEGKSRIPLKKDIAFFGLQNQIVFRNRDLVDPENIDEYIACDGYAALAKALTEMSPEDVIETITKSGLRGRGGAGFSTGTKWAECRKYETNPKYVICNAHEGDPNTFIHRSLMESDPHSILEGMALAGYAIGAQKGYIYIAAEYSLAIQRLAKALVDAQDYGLLGDNILNKGFKFDIEIHPGAVAFICGESSAVIHALEGKRGMPRVRPPHSVENGLWGYPTVVNNVETLANLNPIILNGAEWFASIGSDTSNGTKVFALAGAVNNTGFVEAPLGTSLKTLIFDMGGGIAKKGKFKAAQVGGPLGGCLPADKKDLPLDFDTLQEAGSIIGSGAVTVLDDTACIVDSARSFMDFAMTESCGKCIPCREGLKAMVERLTDIIEARGKEGDVEWLEVMANHVKETSLCGFGKTAVNPVLSTIRYFRAEYDAHIKDGHCPALVCPKLIDFVVMVDKCKKCGMCFRNCPSNAITWEKKQVAKIDLDKCTKCRTCIQNCKFGAIR